MLQPTGYEPCALTASRRPYPPVQTLCRPSQVSPFAPQQFSPILAPIHPSLDISTTSHPFFTLLAPFEPSDFAASIHHYGSVTRRLPEALQSKLPAMAARHGGQTSNPCLPSHCARPGVETVVYQAPGRWRTSGSIGCSTPQIDFKGLSRALRSLVKLTGQETPPKSSSKKYRDSEID